MIAVATTMSDWRQSLPVLASAHATVRELRMDDAASLLTMISTEEVSRFISWGTGMFVAAAQMVLGFAFDTAGVHRLEARASVANGRGNGALRKIGAVQEGVLRRAFFRGGAYHDQVLWSILAEDWHFQRLNRRPQIH